MPYCTQACQLNSVFGVRKHIITTNKDHSEVRVGKHWMELENHMHFGVYRRDDMMKHVSYSKEMMEAHPRTQQESKNNTLQNITPTSKS